MRLVDLKELENAVKNAREDSNWVIVNFHWEVKYQKETTDKQKILAHFAIDSGADIIIGHHPHITQPVGYYRKKPIFYSLGNFLFDQSWSQKNKKRGNWKNHNRKR